MNDVLLRVIKAIIIAHFIRKPPTSEQKKVRGFQLPKDVAEINIVI